MGDLEQHLITLRAAAESYATSVDELFEAGVGGRLRLWLDVRMGVRVQHTMVHPEGSCSADYCGLLDEPLLLPPRVLLDQVAHENLLVAVQFEPRPCGNSHVALCLDLDPPIHVTPELVCVDERDVSGLPRRDQVGGEVPRVRCEESTSKRDRFSERVALGVLGLSDAIAALPVRDSEARAWLVDSGLVRDLCGRQVVLRDELVAAVRDGGTEGRRNHRKMGRGAPRVSLTGPRSS